MVMRAAAMVRTNSRGSSGVGAEQRRAFDLHQVVDRHRLRIGIEVGELRDEPGALAARFSHADDAAAAHVDAGVAHSLERFQAIAIRSRRHDLAVELGRGIEVVVVVVETGLFQAFGLARPEHAQRRAGLESERLDRAHHRQHRFELALLGPAPGRAHAEARRTRVLRGARCRDDHVRARAAPRCRRRCDSARPAGNSRNPRDSRRS